MKINSLNRRQQLAISASAVLLPAFAQSKYPSEPITSVLDLTRVVAGPRCALTVAELGAYAMPGQRQVASVLGQVI